MAFPIFQNQFCSNEKLLMIVFLGNYSIDNKKRSFVLLNECIKCCREANDNSHDDEHFRN